MEILAIVRALVQTIAIAHAALVVVFACSNKNFMAIVRVQGYTTYALCTVSIKNWFERSAVVHGLPNPAVCRCCIEGGTLLGIYGKINDATTGLSRTNVAKLNLIQQQFGDGILGLRVNSKGSEDRTDQKQAFSHMPKYTKMNKKLNAFAGSIFDRQVVQIGL
jgi:hypothetical protein